MSQQDPDVARGRQRRSSLLVQAKKEGINVQGVEILRGLSASLQQNVVRLSNGPKAATKPVPKKSVASLLPTPLSSVPRIRHGSASSVGPTGPRMNNAAQIRRNFMEATACSSAKSRIAVPTSSASQRRDAGNLPPKSGAKSRPRPTLVPHPSRKDRTMLGANNTMNTMHRSASLDSNAWTVNSLMTPSVTPGRSMMSRSPGSLRRWGSQSNVMRDQASKNFKMPSMKDTKVLASMMQCVHTFLVEHRCSNVPATPAELRNISTNTYYTMVNFAAQFLVGNKFLTTKDDMATKIVEVANTLKYPGTISKSHLKSANAQHSWPSSLTFLTWLCCRAESAYSEAPTKPMDELVNDAFSHIALENYLNIYYYQLANESPRPDGTTGEGGMIEAIEDQLKMFRSKVSERLMGEGNSSLEELTAQKEEKVRELEEIKAIPNPTKEVSNGLENTNRKLQDIENKCVELNQRIDTCKNTNSLQSQAEILRMEIKSQEHELESLKLQLSSQPMDKQTEIKRMTEIDKIRKERECLCIMLKKLEDNLAEKREQLEQLESQFRQIVSQFTVVETFNSYLTNLQVEGLSIPVNPFTPEELDVWLTTVAQIHVKTEKASHHLITAVNADQRKFEDAEVRADEDKMNCNGKLETKKAYLNAMKKVHAEKEREKIEETKSLEAEVAKLNSTVETKDMEITDLRRKFDNRQQGLNQLEIKCKQIEEVEKEWKQESINCHAASLLVEARFTEKDEEFAVYTDACVDEYYKMKREMAEVDRRLALTSAVDEDRTIELPKFELPAPSVAVAPGLQNVSNTNLDTTNAPPLNVTFCVDPGTDTLLNEIDE